MGKIIKDGIVYAGTADSAAEIRYDNKSSGLKGKNVQTALDDLSTKIGDGGGITLTQAEYDALPEDQKLNGTYYITDADEIIDACLIGFNNKNTGLKSTNIQDVIVEVFRSGGTGGSTSGGGSALSMHPLSVVATKENQTTFDIDLAGFDASADIVLVQSGRTMLFPNSDFTVVGSQVVLNEGVPIDRTIGIYVFKNAPVSDGGFGRLESYQFVIEAETNGQTTFTIPLESFDATTDTLIVIDGQSVLLPNVGYTVAGRTITMTEPWSLGDGGGIIVLKSAAGSGDLGDITAEDIGALPITGGELSGDLYLKKCENGYGRLQKNHSDTADFGSELVDYAADGKSARLRVMASNNLPLFVDNANNQHQIYGEHNKDIMPFAPVFKETQYVYVSPSGSDETGDGTRDNPWKTIQKAVNESPDSSHGSVAYAIYMADGIYDERVNIHNKHFQIDLHGSQSANGVVIKGGIYLLNSSYCALAENITLGATDTTETYMLIVINSHVYCTGTGDIKIIGNKAVYTEGIRCQENGSVVIPRSSRNNIVDNCKYAAYVLSTGRIFIGNLVINSNCEAGLLATDGGVLSYCSTGITNNASTKTYTDNGGRIYADAQTSVGNY